MLGDHGIFKLAGEAKNKTENAIETEKENMNSLEDNIDASLGNVKIPEGLEVGSTVAYNPSGTYHWLHKYCSSTKAEKAEDGTTDAYDLLESGTGKDFNLAEWKVLSIDKTTGKVELVPSTPTTGTVYLGQAQGYNNGVKLLNDACSNLYGNSTKGITARSINIGDIEKYMTEEALKGDGKEGRMLGAHNYVYPGSNTKYGDKVSSAYTSNKNYPVIYAKERYAVINETTPADATLDLSDTLDRFIERSEGIAGTITTAISIQPTQTYWNKDDTFMQTAFEEYTKKDNTKVKYYDLIMQKGTSQPYWVASRCINAISNLCGFGMSKVDSGSVGSLSMRHSDSDFFDFSLALFPIISLRSRLIKSGTDGNFVVSLE